MSHRGPLPLRDFSPPTKHECGETLGDLEPVYDLRLTTASEFTLPEAVTSNRQPGGVRLCKAGRFSYVDLTPPPFKELPSTDETRVWREA